MDEPHYFIFMVGLKLLGLSLAAVDRVLPAARLLEPPQSAPGLAGFLNYRGQMIPILNLRAMLGLSVSSLRASNQIVLVRAWNSALGLIVDEALWQQFDLREKPKRGTSHEFLSLPRDRKVNWDRKLEKEIAIDVLA